ncbi:SPASM domain-containing protein [Acidovorax sp. LjRoot66]|uniref:SPASM domain-containing protein n=1 Tax=Acidovorax sp. LjRoot66 TaxID=3342334 RepID=UPI003ECFD29E
METVKDCHHPWTWMMVTADGAVTPCCFASGRLGNLNEASADAIWNGVLAMELRAFIKADRVHDICRSAPCKYVQNMPGEPAALQRTPEQEREFDGKWYLSKYPDVAEAVAQGTVESAWAHYRSFGRVEAREARCRNPVFPIPVVAVQG